MQAQRERITALAIALLFIVIAGSMLLTAYSYTKASSLLPRFAGWIFLSLASIETVIQLTSLIRARRGRPASTEAHLQGRGIRELKGFLWLACMLVMLYLAGFLVATPLFIFAFLRISAGQSVARSALIAVAATGFVWLGFVELLDYRLFAGVLFR